LIEERSIVIALLIRRKKMSSLNAAQADGYYIPPDYLESGAYKKQSLNKFNKNKGHNQYLLNSVVRFELPYDGFCSCGAHVGKGTRFNARKEHVDDYFSTKIWEFTMKCRACSESKFVIRTNPKGRCFDYLSGIKKKVEEFDTIDAGSLGVIDTDDGRGIQKYSNGTLHGKNISDATSSSSSNVSAIDKLQQEKIGERKALTERDAMEYLMKHNDNTMHDDATSNSKLRSTYRVVRKAKKRRLLDACKKGLGKGIELPEISVKDTTLARSAFVNEKNKDEKSRMVEREKFSALRGGSIFQNNAKSSHHVNQKQSRHSPESCRISKIDGQEKQIRKRKVILKNGAVQVAKSKTGSDVQDGNPNHKNQTSLLLHLVDAYGSDSD